MSDDPLFFLQPIEAAANDEIAFSKWLEKTPRETVPIRVSSILSLRPSMEAALQATQRRMNMEDMIKIDVSGVEEWREYDFEGRVYRINKPVSVEFRTGSSTHRVTDTNGVVHCAPAPGYRGCVLRWKGPVIA